MQNIIVTRPMQWASTPDILDTAPLDDDDKACFREIRDVLAKYGRLDRFGVSLIHKHFDMADNECLVETVDKTNRMLIVQTVKKDAARNTIETQWQLGDGSAYMECRAYCDPAGGHARKHNVFF